MQDELFCLWKQVLHIRNVSHLLSMKPLKNKSETCKSAETVEPKQISSFCGFRKVCWKMTSALIFSNNVFLCVDLRKDAILTIIINGHGKGQFQPHRNQYSKSNREGRQHILILFFLILLNKNLNYQKSQMKRLNQQLWRPHLWEKHKKILGEAIWGRSYLKKETY